MAVLTTFQKAQLTKMNRAAQKVALGALLGDLQSGSGVLQSYIGASGSHLVDATDASASKVTIQTSVSTVKGFLVQASLSGSGVSASRIKVTTTGSNLYVQTTGSSVVPGEAVYYVAW